MAVPPDENLAEIKRRGQFLLMSIDEQLLALSAREYPTRSPEQFASYLQRLVGGLRALLADTDNPGWAKLVCQFGKGVASHVRFLESANYPTVPWTLIKPMEELVSAIVPGSRIVLRGQWLWNYKIRPVSESYKKALDALPTKYFKASLFAAREPAWNVVSLPRVDSGNIMMHVILGHELGHPIAKQFLDMLDSDRAVSDEIARKIRASIGEPIWADPEILKLSPVRKFALKGRIYKVIDDIRRGALEELISDVVGLYLFGPGFLFGMFESSLDASLDGLPRAPQYHPQWRYRYRFLLEECARQGHEDLLRSLDGSDVARRVRDACLDRIRQMKVLVASTTDKAARDGDEYMKRAYPLVEEALAGIPTFVRDRVRTVKFDTRAFRTKLEAALQLLALGIPPAAREARGGDFRYAVLAGWCYKTAQLPIPMLRADPWTVEDDVTLGRLIQKALEYRTTTEDYDRWVKLRHDSR